MNPIKIDLSGLKTQLAPFGIQLSDKTLEQLTETCVNAVTAVVYSNWQAIAKQKLHGTLPEYLHNIVKVDKGRFAKEIVLTGILPNMIEQGASPFDLKEGFKKSSKVRYTIPVYRKGKQVRPGGDWYLSIPFRIGVPGTLGQAGFTGAMPQAVYDVMRKKSAGISLRLQEIPSPYDERLWRASITTEDGKYYAAYHHKNSIYEGMMKRTAMYGKTTQNTYGTFRTAGANSDPMSWIHKGLKAQNIAEEAYQQTDAETIVQNEVTSYLNTL